MSTISCRFVPAGSVMCYLPFPLKSCPMVFLAISETRLKLTVKYVYTITDFSDTLEMGRHKLGKHANTVTCIPNLSVTTIKKILMLSQL